MPHAFDAPSATVFTLVGYVEGMQADRIDRELCVVTPSRRKIWDSGGLMPVKAGEAYTGTFSRKCQRYASMFYPSWCILDAMHGFLFPEDEIPQPHGRCLFRKETGPISVDELRRQVRSMCLDGYDRIVVLGGRRFIELVEEAFPDRRVRAPLAGRGGIGHMMGALGAAMSAGRRL